MATGDPSLRRLARQLTTVEQRLKHLETVPQLANSSLDDHGMPVYDANGNIVAKIGKQDDGTWGAPPLDGPVPPQPTGVSATGDAGVINIAWDGTFASKATAPLDFDGVEILVGGALAGAIHDRDGGSTTIAADEGTHVVAWRTRSLAAKVSAPSNGVEVQVLPPPSKIAEGLADAEARLLEAEGGIESAAERAAEAEQIADGTKARLDDPSADLAEAIVQAMTTETKFLVVTDEAILNHATLLGETVVDRINVRDKLIGTDGVFTGTVDFANINVTGDVLAANISGEHLYGTVVEGGLIKTTDGLQGQVELADDGYVDADGTKYPGVRITPVDSSGVSVKPAIGPNGYGLKINGGRSSSGASSYAALDFNGAQLNWSKGSSSAKAGVFSDQASMNFTGSTGEGQLLASSSVVQISQENTAGSAIIQVDKDAAILEKRKGSTGYQLRLEDSGLWYVDGSTSFLINDLWEPTWNNLPIASGWSWPHGRRPAYAVVGNKVLMRGRYGRADGGNFLTSESYSPFDMPPALRPAETTSGLGNVAGFVNAGCCRLEQSSGGTFTFGVSKNTSWIAMDGFSYDLI